MFDIDTQMKGCKQYLVVIVDFLSDGGHDIS